MHTLQDTVTLSPLDLLSLRSESFVDNERCELRVLNDSKLTY